MNISSQTDEIPTHEAFEEEERKLASVVLYIRSKGQSLDGRGAAADPYAQNAVKNVLNEYAATLRQAIDQPYFGRLDYYHTDEGASPPSAESDAAGESADIEPAPKRVIYLGGSHIPDQDVYNWTAPVGKLWYSHGYEDGYTAPKGYIAARIDLKRFLRIRDGRLEYVGDIFRRRLPAPAPDDGGDAPFAQDAPTDALTDALSGVGEDDGHLTVIIETIEPEQYESIANVSDKVLIVQGAAGSGKSEIGLHRIAFLLSPFSDIAENERPTPETTLLVGPSRAFLDNVDDVLPNLGVAEGVERVRFSEWLSARMSADALIRPRIWNDLLHNGEVSNFHESAERFKGSLAMADAMDKFVSERTKEIRKRCESLPPVLGPDGGERVSQRQVMDALDAALPKRGDASFLNVRRADFIRRIREIIERGSPVARRPRRPATQSRAADAERRERAETERIRTAIRAAATEWCDAAWPPLDFRREYAALLSDAGEMIRLSANRLNEDDARALAESVAKNVADDENKTSNEFGDADMGALAYLDHLLNGTLERKYNHIVVDEAQDISPIEFRLLEESSGNNWFTILGDTAQRLTPYRGVRSWKRDLNPVFGRDDIEVQPARKSYRSTRRVTEFANRILRTFDKNIPAPIPYDRDGARVEYSRHPNADAMYRAALEDIGRVRAMDGLADATVAVLARDTRNLNRFKKFAAKSGFGDIISPLEAAARSRAVFARVPDAKGLEFDAVIIIGANESFSDTLFNKKLLYLAATRAKHYLGIHWSGRQSPILSAISERGVRRVER